MSTALDHACSLLAKGIVLAGLGLVLLRGAQESRASCGTLWEHSFVAPPEGPGPRWEVERDAACGACGGLPCRLTFTLDPAVHGCTGEEVDLYLTLVPQ